MSDKETTSGTGTDTDNNTLRADHTPVSAAAIAQGNPAGIRTKVIDVEKNSGAPNSDDDDKADDDKNGVAAPAQGPSPFGDAPDGGLKAWLVVLGAWATSFCSFGWINSIGVFQDYYENGPLSNYSSSTISWIPSLQLFFIMALGPVIGRLFDAYGPRYLILGGTLLHVFGLMMASLSSQYYQFMLSQGVCSAIGAAAIFQPALSCLPGWFSKRRGLAYGILATGTSVGGVIFPIMVSRLIDSVGYGWAMRASAFLILGLLIMSNLTVSSRYHDHPDFQRAPPLTGKQMVTPFLEPGFATMLAGIFFMTFGIFAPIDYIPVAALATGNVTPSLALYMVSIFNALSLFGRLLAGWVSDRIGKYNTFIIACYAAGVVVLALWIPGTNRSAQIGFAAIFGFFSGAYIALIGSLVAQVSAPKEIGYRTGLVFLIAAIPSLTTSPIAGAILSVNNSWLGVKIFSGVLLLLGSSVTLAARVIYTGFKPTAVF
ncbi:monocarboxylate transporter [Sporothrix schenckii 1099-18]|uniref:Monocarboxylate transporter n=1 Tax=Sporothrix schenckii 1099-18 TaxID=1397361 RepID=A0A0F2M648_SPOSC|nr:monocarboxylate transporter [Sporothrix schenckii 1099-18]KJR84280.1 monocarboxylate transporter [Sporothrix schenckii 1099-18]